MNAKVAGVWLFALIILAGCGNADRPELEAAARDSVSPFASIEMTSDDGRSFTLDIASFSATEGRGAPLLARGLIQGMDIPELSPVAVDVPADLRLVDGLARRCDGSVRLELILAPGGLELVLDDRLPAVQLEETRALLGGPRYSAKGGSGSGVCTIARLLDRSAAWEAVASYLNKLLRSDTVERVPPPGALSPACPSPKGKLTPADAAAGDRFGFSVAVSGSTIVVGAPGSASVYVFACTLKRAGWQWAQQAKLTASDATTGSFGWSVAISGNTLVVGVPSDQEGGFAAGAAYVFVRKGTSWTQQAKLTASDAVEGKLFGSSVAISGSTIVVGARGDGSIKDLISYPGPGSAYVFVPQGAGWLEQAKLTAQSPSSDDSFGAAVAISGNTVIVGAPGLAGAAYVFSRQGTSWSQQATLTAATGQLGWSVAIDHHTAVVGAVGGSSGSTYVFVRSGDTWTQQAELPAKEDFLWPRPNNFGWSVAVSKNTIVVGDPYADDTDVGDSGFGASYFFKRQGTTWAELFSYEAPAGTRLYGWSVAIDPKTTVVGVIGPLGGPGGVYVFGK